jgi:hypothetical protein
MRAIGPPRSDLLLGLQGFFARILAFGDRIVYVRFCAQSRHLREVALFQLLDNTAM